MADMVEVKVLRPFYYPGGTLLKKDDVVRLPRVFAAECLAVGKVVSVAEIARNEAVAEGDDLPKKSARRKPED